MNAHTTDHDPDYRSAWLMPSDSTPGLFDRVSIDPRTDLFVCSCPDHQMRARDCKHIRRVQAGILGHLTGMREGRMRG
jgi:hypothetical protein